ncbi:hypothetical protein QE152_g7814 [Popillia japonica]|uniref:Uncharacterized protein n=1 Tax=Popillia japonica TaxID=7064 RepID=A0AAW1M7S9_POPJA
MFFHKAIKTTPFRLLRNYEPRNYDGNPLEYETRERKDATDIATKRADALANILRDQEEQRRRCNKKRASARKYIEGDMVVIRKDPVATGQSKKLMPKYAGSYIITQELCQYMKHEIQEEKVGQLERDEDESPKKGSSADDKEDIEYRQRGKRRGKIPSALKEYVLY